MTRVLDAVRPTDALMAAIRLMVKENIHRVIVVDDAGLLAVTSMDVMRALAHIGPEDEGHLASAPLTTA
jgi:CBS domain-containing protein